MQGVGGVLGKKEKKIVKQSSTSFQGGGKKIMTMAGYA